MTATISVTQRQVKSLFTIKVNGNVKQNYEVTARLKLSDGSQLLSSASITFDADDDITEKLVKPLVAAVFNFTLDMNSPLRLDGEYLDNTLILRRRQ